MHGKITWCGAKWLDRREKERKSLSPLRQKASVVSKSTLIWDLADPAWRKLVVKKKKKSQVILFTFAIWGLRLFFMQTLWFKLKVWISPLPPLTPTPLAPQMTFWSNGNGCIDGNESEQKLCLSTSQQKPLLRPLSSIFPLNDLFFLIPQNRIKSVYFNFRLAKAQTLSILGSSHWSKRLQEQKFNGKVKGRIYSVTLNFMDLCEVHRATFTKRREADEPERKLNLWVAFLFFMSIFSVVIGL